MPVKRIPENILAETADAMTLVLKYCGLSLEQVNEAFRDSYERVEIPESAESTLEPITPEATRFIGNLITNWRTKPEFLDKLGAPLDLPKTGAGQSLQSLFERTADGASDSSLDISFEEVATRLVEHDAAQITPDGHYKLIISYLHVNSRDTAGAAVQLDYIRNFARTIAHNTYQGQGGRCCLVARCHRFPVQKIALINGLLEDQGLNFLESLDEELDRYYVPPSDTETATIKLGVGLYLIEDP